MSTKIILLLFNVLSIISFSCNQPADKKKNPQPAANKEMANQASEPAVQKQTKPPDRNILIGDWTRTDSPYQIKITELSDDGTMKAGYFNPTSIHVGKANWAFVGGILKIYIELRDENYPGSNYTLVYYPDRDLLAGKYYQAVEGVSYDIGFLRTKK
jgi:hypothetical protein